MSVKAPAEKNFRRSKVKPVKKTEARRLSRRALRIVLPALLALFAAYRAFDLVLTAATLRVQRINLHGNDRLSSGEVQALIDGIRGSNILSVDLAEYRVRLKQSPWVAEVALRRVLPSTIEVFISERRPLGVCRLGNQLYLLDRTAFIIDEYGPQYANLDLPIIDGVVRAPSGGGGAKARGVQPVGEPVIDEERTDLAARVIDSLTSHKALLDRVSQIDVSDSRDALLLLDNDTALLHIGNEKFVERLQLYLDMAPALKQHVPEMDYVDLRFGKGIVVHPVGGKARSQSAAPAAMDPDLEAPPEIDSPGVTGSAVTGPAVTKNAGGHGSKPRPVKPGPPR
ncbi:MAG: FtsQ-type POTRA domain-containing protein [Vicinamibacterales bacterium]